MNMIKNSLLLLFTALSLAIETPLSARTCTEAATGRTVVLEATNNGDQAISQLRVSIALLREDGSVKDTSPHTTTGYFGKLGDKTLGEGVEALIAQGVDLDAKTADGQTPLQLAVACEHDEIAQLLRRHGATE